MTGAPFSADRWCGRVGGQRAGGDRVDGDVLAAQFPGQDQGDRVDGALGRGVAGVAGQADYRTRAPRTQAVPVSVSSVLVGGRAEVGCSTGRVSVMRRP